jgi:5-oxopent-3-ene-1,2,5-tricarboxylate decarboxylase / 2-hydroxyhepta-2,4-diene-1,7-dioate isomerase
MLQVHDHRLRLSGEASPRDTDAQAVQALLAGAVACEPAVEGAVYATLLNDRAALAALGNALHEAPYKAPPQAPVLYLKPRNTLAGHRARVVVPSGVDALEVGISLGIVIGETASRLSADNALAHVAGFVIVADISVPHASVYRPSVRMRARDGFCPVGPAIVARRLVTHPDSLRMSVALDGEPCFEASTSGAVRNVATLLADVTDFMTLATGDVLTLGVPHGAPLARAGQHAALAIEGLGTLEIAFVREGAQP